MLQRSSFGYRLLLLLFSLASDDPQKPVARTNATTSLCFTKSHVMEFPEFLYPRPVPCEPLPRSTTPKGNFDGDIFRWMGTPGFSNITDTGKLTSQINYPAASDSSCFVAETPSLPMGDPEILQYPFFDVCCGGKASQMSALAGCVEKLTWWKANVKRFPRVLPSLSRLKTRLQEFEGGELGLGKLLARSPGYSYIHKLTDEDFDVMFQKHKRLTKINESFRGGCVSMVQSCGSTSHSLARSASVQYHTGDNCNKTYDADQAVLGDAVLGDAVLGDAVLGDAVLGDAVLGDAVPDDKAIVAYACGEGLSRLTIANISFIKHKVDPMLEFNFDDTLFQVETQQHFSDCSVLLRTRSFLEVKALHLDDDSIDKGASPLPSCRLDVKKSEFSTMNRYYGGEVAFVHGPCVKLWDYGSRSEGSWQTVGKPMPHRQIYYGCQPKHLVSVTNEKLRLFDLRTQGREPLTLFDVSSYYVTRGEVVATATRLESNPHQHAVVLRKCAVLIDDRFAKYEMLNWSVPSLTVPQYVSTRSLGDTEVIIIATQEDPETFCIPVTTARDEPPCITETPWRVCPIKDFLQSQKLTPFDLRANECRVDKSVVGVGVVPMQSGGFSVLQLSGCGDLYQQTYRLADGAIGDRDKTHSCGPKRGFKGRPEQTPSAGGTAEAWCSKVAAQVKGFEIPQEEVPACEQELIDITGCPAHLAGVTANWACELCSGPAFTSTQPSQANFGGVSSFSCEGLESHCYRCGMSLHEGRNVLQAVTKDKVVQGDVNGDTLVELSSQEIMYDVEGKVLRTLWNKGDPAEDLLRRDRVWTESKAKAAKVAAASRMSSSEKCADTSSASGKKKANAAIKMNKMSPRKVKTTAAVVSAADSKTKSASVLRQTKSPCAVSKAKPASVVHKTKSARMSSKRKRL